MLVTQSCPTLHNHLDCSPPGFSVHGILQARTQSGLPFPSLGDLCDPGIEPGSPALKADSLPSIVSQFSCSVVSDTSQPQGLQHVRLPCPSLSPGVCSNSRPLSWWCHPTISSSVTPFSCLQSFPVLRKDELALFNELALRIRWPKYWSFGISPSNEYSGLISFRVDWLISLLSNGLL